MTELIIIRTNNSQPIKKLLKEKQINYEFYQTPGQNLPIDWETKALKEWKELSDEQLNKELDSLND